MTNAAAKPTATITTGHIQPPADQPDTEAATIMLQGIAQWLAQALVDAGGELDLRIHLKSPGKRSGRKPSNVYLMLAAVYDNPDRSATPRLRKEPKAAKAAASA